MSPRARNVTLLILVGFVAFLLWSTLSSQRVECAVAAASRMTGRAVGQMVSNRGGLFRRKLVIQIFPQSIEDLSTFHSRHPSPGQRPTGRGTPC